jgi:hypothetical protein
MWGKVLYPLANLYDRLLNQCPNCNETWFDMNPRLHPTQPQAAQQVASIIAQLRKIAERTDLHANVRLQVSNPKGQTSA